MMMGDEKVEGKMGKEKGKNCGKKRDLEKTEEEGVKKCLTDKREGQLYIRMTNK